MYINLTDAELSIIMDALNTALEDRESENRYTDANDILEANTSAIDTIDAVIDNLRSQMESPVERLSVAVEVKGGLVQAAYANGDIFVDVYDLDVSDFPDIGEQEAADLRELDLKKLVSNPEWHTVYNGIRFISPMV